uniref:Serine aminopeptidase S33 domain-containing protein n=1 Tax=Cajanus cajan TaxID=3821 RepID=A0A151SM81_CAJCA|nr:hypothetical protein KK1_002111 [Cajanus cajan]
MNIVKQCSHSYYSFSSSFDISLNIPSVEIVAPYVEVERPQGNEGGDSEEVNGEVSSYYSRYQDVPMISNLLEYTKCLTFDASEDPYSISVKVKLWFDDFTMGVLRVLNVAPTQLHPNRYPNDNYLIVLPHLTRTSKSESNHLAKQSKGLMAWDLDLFYIIRNLEGKIFDIWCLHIPVADRTPFTDLVKIVETTVKSEYQRSPNRPIYLVGESLGACLALAVSALNPDIDLVLILANPVSILTYESRNVKSHPHMSGCKTMSKKWTKYLILPSPPNFAATSFSRSNLQLLTPLLDALPDPLSPSLPNILKLTAGESLRTVLDNVVQGLPLQNIAGDLAKDFTTFSLSLPVLADILPKETLLWKLKLLKSASAYAHSRLYAIKAQTLILSRDGGLFTLYSQSYKNFKQEFFRVALVDVDPLEDGAFYFGGLPKFPFYWCSAPARFHGLKLGVPPYGLLSLSGSRDGGLFTLYSQSYKNFKQEFFRVALVDVDPLEDGAFSFGGLPKFPFYWCSAPARFHGVGEGRGKAVATGKVAAEKKDPPKDLVLGIPGYDWVRREVGGIQSVFRSFLEVNAVWKSHKICDPSISQMIRLEPCQAGEALGIEVSLPVFLHFYQLKLGVPPYGLLSLSGSRDGGLFTLYSQSYKNFKQEFFRVALVDVDPLEDGAFYTSTGQPLRLMEMISYCLVNRKEKDYLSYCLNEGSIDLVTIIKGTSYYRRGKYHDYASDFLPPTPDEARKIIESYSLLNLVTSPVTLSTLEDGTIVKGLAGIPSDGPVLFVGYHMLMGLEKIHLYRSMGAVPVTPINLFKLFSSKSHVLLYPGGIREAFHKKGEEYKLFWPEQSEFVRMAARFGAKIVPFGAVGEDDLGQVVFDYDDLVKIPYFRSEIESLTNEATQFRSDVGGEVANQQVHLPVILPKVPGRFYFYFGKPLETEGRKQELRDREKSRELYLLVKSEVERCIAYLKVKREKDPYRGIGPRLLYQATHGFESEVPTFEI